MFINALDVLKYGVTSDALLCLTLFNLRRFFLLTDYYGV